MHQFYLINVQNVIIVDVINVEDKWDYFLNLNVLANMIKDLQVVFV